MAFPPNDETDEQIDTRAEHARRALGAAIECLSQKNGPPLLGRYILREPPKPSKTREEAHAQVGAFMMGAKALAEVLGVNAALAVSARVKGEPNHTMGVDAWASEFFDLAQRFEAGAGAIRAAHAAEMAGQVQRLDSGCVEAKRIGEMGAGPLFDRSRVGSDEDGEAP